MQENIVVGIDSISGTLKYITGYTGFDESHEELQSGNYIALKCTYGSGVTAKCQLLGGQFGEVTLDSDKNIVIRITNKDTQQIKFVFTKNGVSETRIYNLSGLTLQTA